MPGFPDLVPLALVRLCAAHLKDAGLITPVIGKGYYLAGMCILTWHISQALLGVRRPGQLEPPQTGAPWLQTAALARRVRQQHERITLTRNGEPEAVLLSVDDLEAWR